MSSHSSVSPKCPQCKGTRQTVITDPPLKGANLSVVMVICDDCHVILGVLPGAPGEPESLPAVPPHPGVNRP